MTEKKILYLFGGVLVGAIILAGVVGYFIGRDFKQAAGPEGNASPGPTPSLPVSQTRQEVPVGTVVPEKNASSIPENVAKPTAVIPAGENTTLKKRIFTVTIDKDKVTPDTIIVTQGDIVDISFSSVDKDYAFVQPDYGVTFSVLKGTPKLFQGQFYQPGKFVFYCPECGGPAAGPRGYFIVVPKNIP